MSNRSLLGCLTAIALVVIAVIAVPVINFTNEHTYTVTITDKERVTTQSAKDNIDSKYLIYGEDENGKTYVFEDTDTLFSLRSNIVTQRLMLPKQFTTYAINSKS